VSERDRLLRAAVYAALDAKGTDGFGAACARIVEVHALWPLIEYEKAIEAARLRRLESESRIAAGVELMRSTYLGRPGAIT
jgi:hypothetical protein